MEVKAWETETEITRQTYKYKVRIIKDMTDNFSRYYAIIDEWKSSDNLKDFTNDLFVFF